ncbi:TetR/AcrR family transcriptional regulator [Eubacterium sp. 1001713B170207_170306_E7]|uniref:TetR/AcrR family transcriptional regulator n=1 Tax=Eubacterium sp. 1001713B170207_170306_E7 TaxID=2787097 RepID=UPI001897133C|nr:TetR/AcrR family transcriptional regulator [Eubacterium sp. 1001713B170207_170306_E7]
MQIKKDEIRQEILLAAEDEFYKRGYKEASMRTIAKKANTTLGNIYNYFKNKEALLDAVVGHIPEKIDAMIEKHREFSVSALTKNNYLAIIGDILPEVFPLDLLMSKGVVILLEGCEGTKYMAQRDRLLRLFSEHLAEHLKLPHDNNLSTAMLKGTIAAFLSIAKSDKSLEERKQDLYDYIVALAFGLPDLTDF